MPSAPRAAAVRVAMSGLLVRALRAALPGPAAVRRLRTAAPRPAYAKELFLGALRKVSAARTGQRLPAPLGGRGSAASAPRGGWAAPVPRGGTAGGSAPGGSVGPREAPGRAALGPPCGPAGVRPVPGRVGVPRAAQLCAAPVSGAESSRWDGRRCAGGVTARRRQGLWARCCVRDGRFSLRSGGAPNRADGFP